MQQNTAISSLDEWVVALGGRAARAGVRSRTELSVSARQIEPFLTLLRTYPTFLTHRFSEVTELDPEARVPIALAHELLALATKESNDPDLGLKAGRLVEVGDHDVLDFAMSTAATVEVAINVATRYTRLLSDAIELHLELRDDRALVRLDSAVSLPRAVADYQASYLHSSRFRSLPIWVRDMEWWFPHEQPADLTEYEATFAPATLKFSAPCFGYTFPAAYLQARMPAANPKLHAVLSSHADVLLAELPNTTSVTDSVRQVIAKELPAGRVTTAQVARRLRLGARTLARRLEFEGTSFSALREDTRRQLAERYVARTQLQFSEIALLVGFSEVATLYRAFRRWTNQTPLEYRRSQRDAVPQTPSNDQSN